MKPKLLYMSVLAAFLSSTVVLAETGSQKNTSGSYPPEFSQIDQNRSNFLEMQEAQYVIRDFNEFVRLDTNHDGRLSQDEYVPFGKPSSNSNDKLKQASQGDANNTQKIQPINNNDQQKSGMQQTNNQASSEAQNLSGQGDQNSSGAQVMVRQQQPQIEVRQATPTVSVQQSKPEITVTQAQPTVTVTQAQPKVTVSQSEPQVTFNQPEPEVIVQQQKPEVTVKQSQPEVKIHQAKPEVKISQSEPHVVVKQELKVNNVQPDKNADPTSKEQANVPNSQRSPEKSADSSNKMTGKNFEMMAGKKLVNSEGQELGEIDKLVVRNSDNMPFAVITMGNYLGFGVNSTVLPAESLKLKEDRVHTEIKKQELKKISYEKDQYHDMKNDETMG